MVIGGFTTFETPDLLTIITFGEPRELRPLIVLRRDFPMSHLKPVPITHVCRYLTRFYKTTCTQQALAAVAHLHPTVEMQV